MVVGVEVCVVVGVVVADVVALVVGVDVGVVTSQLWKPPEAKASVMAVMVSTAGMHAASPPTPPPELMNSTPSNPH